MRYAVLSDIHANLPALQAALASLRHEQVTGYLCLGDTVGYGPQPNECVELVASLNPVCVAGNHDLIAAGLLDDGRSGSLARESLQWTRKALGAESRRFLEALPRRTQAPGRLVLAHGSLDDVEEYVETPERARMLLDDLANRYHDARTLLLGHTHQPWAFARDAGTVMRRATGTISMAADSRFLLNPGSVGQSRDRLVGARFMVLDVDESTATFHSVPFDERECAAALRRAGLPARSFHMPTRLRHRAGHAVRRVWQRGR